MGHDMGSMSHLGPWADDVPAASPTEARLERLLPDLILFAKAVSKETAELRTLYVYDPRWAGLHQWAEELVSKLERA